MPYSVHDAMCAVLRILRDNCLQFRTKLRRYSRHLCSRSSQRPHKAVRKHRSSEKPLLDMQLRIGTGLHWVVPKPFSWSTELVMTAGTGHNSDPFRLSSSICGLSRTGWSEEKGAAALSRRNRQKNQNEEPFAFCSGG